MLVDGINLVEGSKIINLTVDSGSTFPTSPDIGELFFNTSDSLLYVYDGTYWIQTGNSSLSLSSISSAENINVIENENFQQSWLWSQNSDSSAFKIGESIPSINGSGNQTLLEVSTLNSSTSQAIRVTSSNDNLIVAGVYGNISLTGGASNNHNTGYGGSVTISGGIGNSAGAYGGSVTISGGMADGDYLGYLAGEVIINGGEGENGVTGGNVYINGGNSSSLGGNIIITSGQATIGNSGNINLIGAHATGNGGAITITGGNSNDATNGGFIEITAGDSFNGVAGHIYIKSGKGAPAGNIEISAGNNYGSENSGIGGNIIINAGNSAVDQAGSITLRSGSTITGTTGQLIFITGDNNSAVVTDTGTAGKWEFEITPKIINPSIVDNNDLTHKQYVDDQDENRVSILGDSMNSGANLTFSGGGEVIGLPTTPSVSTAAVSKAYVDNLISGSITWKFPIECPNLQDIVSSIPTPIDRGSYIKFGGTQNETWGSVTNVVDNDIMEYTTAGGWKRLGILTIGTRFIVAGEVGTAGAGAIAAEMRTMDLVEYGGGDADLAASWIKPHAGNVQGVMFGSVAKTGSSPTGLANDSTVYNANIKVNDTNYPITVTGSAAQTFTNLISEINADLTGATASIVDGHIHVTGDNETDAILIADTDLFSSMNDYTEIRGTVKTGTTVLTHNDGCVEYGHTYLYSVGNHAWVEISGPGSIQAGVGLAYDGNILNISLGAGIQELPTDEVGIDIYPSSGLMTTVDGTNSSTATNSRLSLTKTGVTGGTYKSVTVDTYGRVTAGTNPTTLAEYGITNAAEINPSSPKNGDIRVTGEVIDIYANGAWRQVFPAVYS